MLKLFVFDFDCTFVGHSDLLGLVKGEQDLQQAVHGPHSHPLES